MANKTGFKEIILTLNIPEEAEFTFENLPLQIVHNRFPKGFASNHNTAFEQSNGDYFCVLNPDIRLIDNPFLTLLNDIEKLKLGMVAPAIIDSEGQLEDSVRKFPTVGRLIKRLITGEHDAYSFSKKDEVFYPDWVGGMFMLFDRKAYLAVKGFDQGYFLYYEDVDICVRLWRKGLPIAVSPQIQVIHQAQRQSHKQLKYLRWHLSSMLRFFIKQSGRLPKTFTRN
jgi:GT2 family glycosyltransferase